MEIKGFLFTHLQPNWSTPPDQAAKKLDLIGRKDIVLRRPAVPCSQLSGRTNKIQLLFIYEVGELQASLLEDEQAEFQAIIHGDKLVAKVAL